MPKTDTLFTTVMLDQPRRIRFRPGLVQYRLGTIKRPLSAKALGNKRTFFAALCQWIYVVLDEDCELDSPEAIAEALDGKTSEQLVEIARTLTECIELYKPPAESKNGSGSTKLPSPASS